MAVRGVEDIQAVSEQAALLRIALLVARDEPHDALFAAVSEEIARLLGVETGAVVRFVGAERAVVVGVWNSGGVRGLPVNAEVDFDRTTSALGLVRSTLQPARVTDYEQARGELPLIMKAIGLRASVAAPVMRPRRAVGRGRGLVGRGRGAAGRDPSSGSCRSPGWSPRRSPTPRRARRSPRRGPGSCSPATRRAAASSARCTRARTSTSSRWRSSCASRSARSTPGSETEEVLRDLLADAMETSAELSELARGLHPAVLSERGLTAALQALSARAEIPVTMRELPGRRYPDVVETTAYLIVSEALANAARHSHATECTLLAADRGDRLVVEVRDDGIGGAELRPGGGLECLADRADAIGARFAAHLRPRRRHLRPRRDPGRALTILRSRCGP